MSNETKSVSINLPIFGILGLIFITLKLTGHITWSWLWVLSPFWIPVAIAVFILLLVAVGVGVAGALSKDGRNRK